MTKSRLILSSGILLCLAACSTGAQEDNAPASTQPSQATIATSIAPSSPATPATISPTESTASNSLPAGACATSQLKVELANEQGAAGSRLADLVFTNISGEGCTLAGFPGVSAVTGNDGTQLGPAATRETGIEAATVTLQPGAQARASMKITNVGLFDQAQCQPQSADGLRVYPPENTDSLFVAVPGLQGCAGEVDYLSVQPITPAS
ncbi:DUF4232 domain-containing protein [Corynebacterium vitaeruminis]|uniref:DUF4232 domain-containing protein n=1 Tax=Corynebacterium vitaeruminis DSM 20294 TaxID=1224164 RepID=W5Y6U5_9CORY|nr:DUF4232 domain-containing protein [Corynebacterium vitaeruminis]AHI22238.1 hypothetical protein B843_04245 [Corynebacterium vitaeruminis DSM 20294]